MRTYFDLHFLCISSQLSYIQVDKHGQCCFYCVFLLICPICFSFYIQCHLRAEWYFSLKIDTNSCQTPINFYPEVVQIFIDCIPLKGQDYLPIFHNWICFICLPAQLHWTPNSGWRKQRHTWESPDIMLADDYSQCYGLFQITLEISTELHLEINFLSFSQAFYWVRHFPSELLETEQIYYAQRAKKYSVTFVSIWPPIEELIDWLVDKNVCIVSNWNARASQWHCKLTYE